MAESITIARPYAKALYEVATAQGSAAAESWLPAMQVCQDLGACKAAVKLINSRGFDYDAFKPLISALFEQAKINKYPEQLDDFFAVLANNQRLGVLPEVASQFIAEANRANNKVFAEIITAKPLSDEDSQLLRERLQAKYQQQVEVSVVIDESLIAGAMIRVGDTVIDGSVKGRLSKLSKAITKT
ncbi:F0F1 ATP synthase subunit delta [Ostreibacterium oceani]|uniref:ATP synthase subunit delta n=1 Tax=Ostreibacterium oceani TaxID=2654998 RepID=A0A6N7EYH7_9GAMM|nr:F0F1 ATP synthase subunit delta [Ostreibacterium oceani]MPV86610.1 F0F1 ATP synthase subunit delta [Ostreibacterium oceani]